VSLSLPFDGAHSISAEIEVTVLNHVIRRSTTDAGFAVILTFEFDAHNRIVFDLIESQILGRKFVQLNLDQSGSFGSCGGATSFCIPYEFEDEERLVLKLEFDPVDRNAKGFILGTEVVRREYIGQVSGDARVSFGVVTRTVGDVADVIFDNFRVTSSSPSFRRGDTNGDGLFDISDPIAILGCLFVGAACSACPDADDTNDDGLVNVADPVFLLLWRFLSGPNPPPPFAACGKDPTADELSACEAAACR
jgi:hypothetical protein